MGLDDRKLEVLKAIVEDYVATEEPVSSRALVERHNLNVSPATVRNDMAVLEEEGYIRQPHTSAGRVPTNRGYRLFVARLSRVKPLPQAERRAIERCPGGGGDLDDVVYRTVRLLAQLTRQVAVVQYPSLTRSSVRHLELVPISTPASCWWSSPTPEGSSSGSWSFPVRPPGTTSWSCAGRSTPSSVASRSPRRRAWCSPWWTRWRRCCGRPWRRWRRCCWRRWWSGGTSGSRWRAPPTSPAAWATSRARCAACWRPWRSRSSCSSS